MGCLHTFIFLYKGRAIKVFQYINPRVIQSAGDSHIKRFCFSLRDFIWIKHEARRYPAEPHVSKYIFVICHCRNPPGDTYDTLRFNTVEKQNKQTKFLCKNKIDYGIRYKLYRK